MAELRKVAIVLEELRTAIQVRADAELMIERANNQRVQAWATINLLFEEIKVLGSLE